MSIAAKARDEAFSHSFLIVMIIKVRQEGRPGVGLGHIHHPPNGSDIILMINSIINIIFNIIMLMMLMMMMLIKVTQASLY